AARGDGQPAAEAARRDSAARRGIRRRRRRAGEPGGARVERRSVVSAAKRGLSLILVLLLAACRASLPPIDADKLPPTPAAYKEGDGRWTVAPPAEAQPRGEWWKAFGDPVLDDLVARANAANASIQVAAARLKQARALVRA